MGPVQNIAFLSGLVALLGLAADAEVLLTADAITPEAGKQVGSIAIGDNMHFAMDVTINSFPTNGHDSVFQCGTSNNDRWPGIFTYQTGIFYVQVKGGSSAGNMGDVMATGQTYHLDVDYTQNWWVVRIDGEIIRSASKSAHSTRESVPCYASADFGHGPADVTIENLVVSTDIGCYFTGFECADDAVCSDDGTCACSADSFCADHLVCHDDGECGRDCTEFPVDDWLLDCSAEFGENENDIVTIKSDIDAVKSDIVTVQSDIATIQSSIATLDSDIDAIQNTLSSKADTATTTALQTSVDDIDADIVTIKSDIETIEDSVNGKADTATTNALQAAIDAINSRLDKLTLSSAHSVPGMVDGTTSLDTDSMKWTLTGKDMTIIALLMVNLAIMATLFVVCRTGSGGKYVYGQ